MFQRPFEEEKPLLKKLIPILVLVFLVAAAIIFFSKSRKDGAAKPKVGGEEDLKSIGVQAMDLSDVYKQTKGSDSIKLSTLGDLLDIQTRCSAKESFNGKIISLENDINLTKDGRIDGDVLTWKAIASEDNPFDGTLDGKEKTLNCNLNFEESDSKPAGYIIMATTQDASVINLNMRGKVEGDYSSFIGENSGKIEGLNVDVTANNTTSTLSGVADYNKGHVERCSVRGEFYTNNMNLSGVCALNEGTISNCNVTNIKLTNYAKKENNTPTTASADNAEQGDEIVAETAGIASYNEGKIEGCSVSGAYLENKNKAGNAGGISSLNNGLISGCNVEATIISGSAGAFVETNFAVIGNCSSKNTNITANEGAEFACTNKFGEEVSQLSELKGGELGVIKDCSFDGGKVDIPNHKEGTGVKKNLADDKTGKKNASIKNCTVNSKPVVR